MKRYIRASETYTYNGMKFDKYQMNLIKDGLEKGLDVSLYANPEYGHSHMWAIYAGLKDGLDVSFYTDTAFNGNQATEIYSGLKDGLDVSWYASPEFSFGQMIYIHEGLRKGLDASQFANPQYTTKQMDNIIKKLSGVYRFKPTSKKVLQEIASRLNVDIDIAKFIAKLHAEDIEDNGFTTDEEYIDYIVNYTADRMEEILLNEGYEGLVEYEGRKFADKFMEAAKALGIDTDI